MSDEATRAEPAVTDEMAVTALSDGEGAATVPDTNHARANYLDSEGTEQSTRSVAAGLGAAGGKSSRINPDDGRFIRAITIGVAFAGLVAFAISFVALMEVAAWLGLPAWMHWAVPAFIDTGILVYAGSVLIHKTRGEKTWPSWLILAAFTGLSVLANTAHALSYAHTLDEQWQSIIGAVIAGMVPMAVFAATEQLSRVAVEDPASRRRELQALAEWHAEQAERERRQLEVEAEREHARQEAELAAEEHQTRLEEVRAQRAARKQRAALLAERAPVEDGARRLHLVSESTAGTEPGESAHFEPVATPPRSSADMDGVAEFVRARTAEGRETSGADLAATFGFSDKTGRRRLTKLREERPEIFMSNREDQS